MACQMPIYYATYLWARKSHKYHVAHQNPCSKQTIFVLKPICKSYLFSITHDKQFYNHYTFCLRSIFQGTTHFWRAIYVSSYVIYMSSHFWHPTIEFIFSAGLVRIGSDSVSPLIQKSVRSIGPSNQHFDDPVMKRLFITSSKATAPPTTSSSRVEPTVKMP